MQYVVNNILLFCILFCRYKITVSLIITNATTKAYVLTYLSMLLLCGSVKFTNLLIQQVHVVYEVYHLKIRLLP